MTGCDLLRDALKKAHAQQLAATIELHRPGIAMIQKAERQEAEIVLGGLDRLRGEVGLIHSFDAAVFALAGVDQ